jgi:hypothetical protein
MAGPGCSALMAVVRLKAVLSSSERTVHGADPLLRVEGERRPS